MGKKNFTGRRAKQLAYCLKQFETKYPKVFFGVELQSTLHSKFSLLEKLNKVLISI